MPSLPAFDYYQELQLERTASIEEIKASYRRLARIHHPDKNPDSLVEATAAFQKVSRTHPTRALHLVLNDSVLMHMVAIDPNRI